VNGILIGAGYFAQFHADAWKRMEGVRITAVADPDRPRAEEFARRFSIPVVYDSAAQALAGEHPDFADIATRPSSHVELTLLAARHGVNVICQKPMAPTLEDCRAMIDGCARAGVRLVIHENWRWQPWYREARQLIDAGHLGRIFHIAFTVRAGDGRGAEPYTVQPYFRTMDRFLTYEMLVHYLDTIRYLTGDIAEVFCRMNRVNPVIAGEDMSVIHSRNEAGVSALIDANRISGPLPPDMAFGTMRLEGDRGLLRMTGDGKLFLTKYGEQERPHPYPIPATGYKGDSILAMQQHIIDCFRFGARAQSEGPEYINTVEAVDACYRSAESGTVIRLR
jgi:predicted dehydrogenase